MLDLTPGFTAIPNDFLDQIAPTLTAAELRVALYIYRHTIGYQKLTDTISYSQFTDGITTTDGRKLDAGAGVSRRSLPAALTGLERRGIISRSGGSTGGGAVRYTIVQPKMQPKAKAVAKSSEPKPEAGSGLEQEPPIAAPLAAPRPASEQKLPASQLQPEEQPGQNLPAPAPQLGQKLPPTIQTDSKIKPDRDRAAAVAFITQEIAGITPKQAEKLVSTAMGNQRDISYIQRLVGYVACVAGNPAAMLTVLINRDEDRTTGPGPGANHPTVHNVNRRKSDLPGYDWTRTLKKPAARNPIDFSKPFYQRLIAISNSNSAFDDNSKAIE